jgi:hypothetical protein
MAMQRKQRAKSGVLPLVAPRSHITRSCDQFGPFEMTADEQRETAELAFSIWLARAFRRGSPQEDWIQAVRQRAGRQ